MSEREWRSVYGPRSARVVGERAFIRTGDSPLEQVLPLRELAQEIARDEKNFASREAIHTKKTSEVASEESDFELLTGFLKRFTPQRAGKIKASLLVKQRFNGKILSRKIFVEDAISDGADVVASAGKRVLRWPSSSYMTEADITKTAMDYAAYLVGSR